MKDFHFFPFLIAMLIQSADSAVKHLVQSTASETEGGRGVYSELAKAHWAHADVAAPSNFFRKQLYLHIKK